MEEQLRDPLASSWQSEGGPIHLRSICAIASLLMGRWDQKWKEQLTEVNIQTEDDER